MAVAVCDDYVHEALFMQRVAADWHLQMRIALAVPDDLPGRAVQLQVEGEIWARSARHWRDMAYPELVRPDAVSS